AVVGGWMKTHRTAVIGTAPLPAGETASVPATAAGSRRYLFALPSFTPGGRYDQDLLPPADATLRLEGVPAPKAVRLMRDGSSLAHRHDGRVLTVVVPAASRTPL